MQVQPQRLDKRACINTERLQAILTQIATGRELSSNMVWVLECSLGLGQAASCVTDFVIKSLWWYCDEIVT